MVSVLVMLLKGTARTDDCARQCGVRRKSDAAAESRWKTTLHHHVALLRLGQTILSGNDQVGPAASICLDQLLCSH